METQTAPALHFLEGGGEMGAMTRAYDWSATTLGAPEYWPQCLRTMVNVVLNSSFPMLLMWGDDLVQIYNDAFRPSLGNNGKHPNAMGQRAADCWRENWHIIKPMFDGVLKTGIAAWRENQLIPIERNGKMEDVYWTFSYSAVKDDEGKTAGLLVVCSETTETVNNLKKVEESEKNIRNVILQAPVAMCILRGPEYEVEIANDRMLEVWGKTSDAIMGKPLFDGLPEARNQGFEELLHNVFTTGESYTAYGVPAVLPRKGGLQTIYINFVYKAFREGDGSISGIMAVASDVTEQVVANKKIENSEARFRLLADSMPQFIWTADNKGDLNYFNQAVYNYSGLSYDELQKEGWLQIVHPDDREENEKHWQHAVSTGEDFLLQHRFRNSQGLYRWQLSRAVALRDDEGNIQLWIGTSTDIHDQKLFEEELQTRVKERTEELEKANEALQKSNYELVRSNANLEEFAYVASHDLKEPIRKVHYFADRLKQRLVERLDDDEMRFFNRMEHATLRMNTLIDDLLEYSHVSRAASDALEDIDLNKKIRLVQEDLELEIQERNAKITVGALPTIKAHRRQMQQMFQNLIGNALKYQKPGVPPEIKISSEIVEGSHTPLNLSCDDKKRLYHMITVADNGIGFEQKDANRIFNIFQRLHGNSEYRGTGVGLSIVRKVVENHNGCIVAEGEPGKGATFRIYLPA